MQKNVDNAYSKRLQVSQILSVVITDARVISRGKWEKLEGADASGEYFKRNDAEENYTSFRYYCDTRVQHKEKLRTTILETYAGTLNSFVKNFM